MSEICIYRIHELDFTEICEYFFKFEINNNPNNNKLKDAFKCLRVCRNAASHQQVDDIAEFKYNFSLFIINLAWCVRLIFKCQNLKVSGDINTLTRFIKLQKP